MPFKQHGLENIIPFLHILRKKHKQWESVLMAAFVAPTGTQHVSQKDSEVFQEIK